MESQWRVRKKVDSQEITSASSSLFQFAHVGISTCCCSPARVGDEKKLNAFDDWDISEILYLKSIYYPNEISANLQICKNWAYPSCRFSSPTPATTQSKGASQNKLEIFKVSSFA